MTKCLQYNFPYIKGRPLITAKLTYKKKSRYFEFLVDSGAVFTFISKSYALLLGIDASKPSLKKKIIKVEVANLTFIKAYKIKLQITIKDESLKIQVLVADREVECLLGRKGVFDYFDILFQENKQQMLLIKH